MEAQALGVLPPPISEPRPGPWNPGTTRQAEGGRPDPATARGGGPSPSASEGLRSRPRVSGPSTGPRLLSRFLKSPAGLGRLCCAHDAVGSPGQGLGAGAQAQARREEAACLLSLTEGLGADSDHPAPHRLGVSQESTPAQSALLRLPSLFRRRGN